MQLSPDDRHAMKNRAIQQMIMVGITAGFLFQLCLAGAQILVCERSRPGRCSVEWDKGFTVSSGLLSTLLVYFIEAPRRTRANAISQRPQIH
jgi:hypothetical protein